MNYFQFWPNDQTWNNWLVFLESKEEPCLRARASYRDLICSRCGRFDHDKAFDIGFEADIRIRARGDIICTSDDFFCTTEKVRALFQEQQIQGACFAPVGNTGWYVMNVLLRVHADSKVYEMCRSLCPVCKRPSSVTGTFGNLTQIEAPTKGKTMFTPTFDRKGYSARDIFATEDVVRLLKDSGVKGGVFERLLTLQEEMRAKRSAASGKSWRPGNSRIRL